MVVRAGAGTAPWRLDGFECWRCRVIWRYWQSESARGRVVVRRHLELMPGGWRKSGRTGRTDTANVRWIGLV